MSLKTRISAGKNAVEGSSAYTRRFHLEIMNRAVTILFLFITLVAQACPDSIQPTTMNCYWFLGGEDRSVLRLLHVTVS